LLYNCLFENILQLSFQRLSCFLVIVILALASASWSFGTTNASSTVNDIFGYGGGIIVCNHSGKTIPTVISFANWGRRAVFELMGFEGRDSVFGGFASNGTHREGGLHTTNATADLASKTFIARHNGSADVPENAFCDPDPQIIKPAPLKAPLAVSLEEYPYNISGSCGTGSTFKIEGTNLDGEFLGNVRCGDFRSSFRP
jgi:hypothetical protein